MHIRGFAKQWTSRWRATCRVSEPFGSRRLEGNSQFATIDFIWGVVDINPDTDYPDVRNLAVIHSTEGSALLIPREGDLLRLYVQLADADVLDPETGRLDKTRASPQKVLEMAKRILRPYRMDPIGDIRWWTMYVGRSSHLH